MKFTSKSILAIIFFFIVFAVIGCEIKPCEDYPCVNGTPQPDAEDCYCICNSGWGGSDCTIENVCVTRNIVCKNGGVCNNGICICDNGFEGDSCEFYVRDKFVGAYTAIDFCSISGVLQYNMTINATSNLFSVSLTSQFADNKFNDSLLASINNNAIKLIEENVDGDSYRISGQGSISNDTLTLLYFMTNLSSSTVDTCSGTWVK